jgi:membrane-bound serine protease (ClpP class)
VARTAIAPAGRVFVHGEIWNAEADEPIEAGTSIRVEKMDGFLLKVAAAEAEEADRGS